jgi:3-oxoacyl-[acyl-carrier-protein] synthase III
MAYVGIRGTNVYFPEGRQDMRFLVESGRTKEDVFRRIGVESITVAGPDDSPTDMGIKAARELMERLQIAPDEIDLVVYVCATLPDYLVWSASAKVAHELGIQNAFGFEVSLGCGGIQPAFQSVKGMMLSDSDFKRALIVSADIWSPFLDDHLGVGQIFADSAAAAILERSDEEMPNRLIAFSGHTDGSYAGLGHMAGITPFSKRLPERYPHVNGHYFQMIDPSNITELNKLNPANYRKVADRALEKSGWKMEELDYVIFPSGRADLMNHLCKGFGIDPERTNSKYLAHQGDLGAPMLLADLNHMFRDAGLSRGAKVLALSAGVGITWMAVTIEI